MDPVWVSSAVILNSSPIIRKRDSPCLTQNGSKFSVQMTVFWPRRLQTFTINCMQKPAHVHRLYNPLYSFTGPGSQKNTVLTCFSHIKLICLKGVRPVFICEPSPVNAPLGSKIPTCIFIDGAMSLNIPPQDTRLKLSYAYLWCRVPLRPLRSSLFICLEEEGFSLPTEASFSFILPMLHNLPQAQLW